MSVLRITTANGNLYLPKFKRTEISRNADIQSVSLIDFDGEYLVKRKNSSRSHNLVIFFEDENTAIKFENDTKDTRPISYLDPVYAIDLTAHILTLSWNHEFTNNVDVFAFDITLSETTTTPNYIEAMPLPTVAQFHNLFENLNIDSRFVNISNFATLCNLLDGQNAFLSRNFSVNPNSAASIQTELARFRLRTERIKESGISEFGKAIDLNLEMSLLGLNYKSGLSGREQIIDFLSEYSKLIAQSDVLIDNILGNSLYYVTVCPLVYCKCSLVANIDYQNETRRFLSQMQDDLYRDYYKLNEIVAGDRASTADKVKTLGTDTIKYLTSTIKEIEENMLSAFQERKIVLKHDSDIYPLVSELYPRTTPESFEIVFSRFIEDNNLHAEELFLLSAGKEITYYV